MLATLAHAENVDHGRRLLQTHTWTKVGDDIDGEAANHEFGFSVSMSSDGTRVAIGATGNDGTGSDASHVQVFQESIRYCTSCEVAMKKIGLVTEPCELKVSGDSCEHMASPEYTHTPMASPEYTHTPTASPEYTHTPTASPEYTHTPMASPEYTHTPTASPEYM